MLTTDMCYITANGSQTTSYKTKEVHEHNHLELLVKIPVVFICLMVPCLSAFT